jgi:hypothetical protein
MVGNSQNATGQRIVGDFQGISDIFNHDSQTGRAAGLSGFFKAIL